MEIFGRIADAIKLSEDKIPDFNFLSVIGRVIDFATRSANAIGTLAGGGSWPKIFVFVFARQTVTDANFVVPDFGSFIVVFVNGNRKASGIDAQPLLVGQEFPSPVDGFAFEIITKAEVAEHFKKGVVVSGAADVFDIAGAEALLAGGRPREFKFDFAEEVIFELIHAGGREQNRFVPAGNQHITGAQAVVLGNEKVEIFLAEFVGLHASFGLWSIDKQFVSFYYAHFGAFK
jgi:hypothetical protein